MMFDHVRSTFCIFQSIVSGSRWILIVVVVVVRMTPVNPLDLWLRTGSKHHPQPEQYIFLDVFTNYRLVRFPEGRTASLLSQENYVLWSPLSLSLALSCISICKCGHSVSYPRITCNSQSSSIFPDENHYCPLKFMRASFSLPHGYTWRYALLSDPTS